jgi:hypothetical protein
MKYFVPLSLALLTTAAQGQETTKPPAKGPESRSYQAPISCTANVPAQVCKDVTSEFSLLQQASKVMGQVEVVVADVASFKQENDRLEARYERSVQAAAGTKDNATFFSLLNHKPVAPSMLGDSVVFVHYRCLKRWAIFLPASSV